MFIPRGRSCFHSGFVGRLSQSEQLSGRQLEHESHFASGIGSFLEWRLSVGCHDSSVFEFGEENDILNSVDVIVEVDFVLWVEFVDASCRSYFATERVFDRFDKPFGFFWRSIDVENLSIEVLNVVLIFAF